MTIEEVKALTSEQAIALYNLYSEDWWCAGWMGGGMDEPPFENFVAWLTSSPESTRRAEAAYDFEVRFAKAWDEWRAEVKDKETEK